MGGARSTDRICMLARMQQKNYREFAPGTGPRVQVTTDGESLSGVLTAWERLGGEWWGYVDHEPEDERVRVYACERILGASPPED